MTTTREGGCFCGAVRYRVEGEPVDAGYCHCRMCQRSAGAPVVAWGTWRRERFRWLTHEPAILRSSKEAQRRFCAACGTQLLFWGEDEPEVVDVNLATLDDPAGVRPDHHIWIMSRIPWFDIADDLPRYRDAGADERARRHDEPPAGS
jgi:hypothetical protein